MHGIYETIMDWSEVWGFLIPLAVIMIFRQFKGMRPIIIYICVALVLNSIATIMQLYNGDMPNWMKNNNVVYNIHSVVRVLFFSWYIGKITPKQFAFIHKTILIVYIVFVVANFSFLESPLDLSQRLSAAESIVLLFLCLAFFLRSIQDDSLTNWIHQPSFLICFAVTLYEALTFFIFLFIFPIFDSNPTFGAICMNIYQVAFIVFCALLGLALYKSRKNIGPA